MEEPRANPHELRKGKLKIFFGAAPGVGKTYAMLEAAQRAHAEHADVVIGVVETHGRSETAALCEGIESIPLRAMVYRGKQLHEFDLDATLRRRPALVVVDELAHTNVPGCRHPKRWQDVMELLDAGLDVWTTLNVQHIESLNDVIAQITHVRVRETVPDAIIERADEIEIVDLPPDALIQRLREGKVYIPDQAQRAEASFFRRGNLLALRELALRRTAEHVDTDVLAYRREHGIATTWPVAEHILVCVGPSPESAALVRASRRMAAGLRARWTAATVETPATAGLDAEARARIAGHLRLAEQLGAEVATLSGVRAADAILEHARAHNVTRIVLGKPTHPRWRDFVFGSLLEEVVRGSGDIDVHVILGDPGDAARQSAARGKPSIAWLPYLWSVGLVALATAAAWAMFGHVELANLVMAYLLGIVFAAYRFGRGPAVFASLLSVAVFDYCFVPPYLTFAVSDVKYLLTFGVMLVVGLIIASLTERVRGQAEAARVRELRTSELYRFTRELASSKDLSEVAHAVIRHVAGAFGATATVLLPSGRDGLTPAVPGQDLEERELSVAIWAYEHGDPAGRTTDTLPASEGLYLPLITSSRTVGVLGLLPADPAKLEDLGQRQFLEAFAHQAAIALERTQFARDAQLARSRAEREELRNSLLSSVSHDLRTPLAAITGAATTLLEDESATAAVRRDLLQTVQEEADRLNRLVGNLLDMTRLESGGLRVQKEWTPLEEVIGSALNRLEPVLRGREVRVTLPPDLPLVPLDGVLMGQVFSNLLENAAKYTPEQSPVEITARGGDGVIVIEISDHGPGIPEGAEERLFDKFFRASEGTARGTGLGLTICRGIVIAHGGTIVAENRPGGGAVFRISLPLEGSPPSIPEEPAESQPAGAPASSSTESRVA